MKHHLLTVLFLSAGYFGFGQCGRSKVVLTSSQTQHLGADSSLQRTDDEKMVIEFDKSTITISPGDNHMTGKVDSIACNWTTPYKVGKTRLRVTITNDQGETKKATITIEGKDGRIVLLGDSTTRPTIGFRSSRINLRKRKINNGFLSILACPRLFSLEIRWPGPCLLGRRK